MYETKAKNTMKTCNVVDSNYQKSKKSKYLLFKSEFAKYKIAHEISENIDNEIIKITKIMISDIMEGMIK